MEAPARFVFVSCQFGADGALKDEVTRRWPRWRLAYSRPGFVTFKVPDHPPLPDDLELDSVFGRAHGFSLGKVVADTAEELAAEAWKLAGDLPVADVHAWQRDTATPGYRKFEPGMTPLAEVAREQIVAAAPAGRLSREAQSPEPQPATPDTLVLDCVLVQPYEWWIGYHRAGPKTGRWAGGFMPIAMPPHAVSRAYLKLEEALRWSELSVQPGDVCAELGCAPGGSAQALLDRGAKVIGVDPAEVDPAVLAHPNFEHLRRRSKEAPKRAFAGVRYLFSDMNVAPNYTLDSVEAIVTHREVKVEGVLLTLKLIEWEQAGHIREYLDRIRGWGFPAVRARQLVHNRQEICVVATRKAIPV
jgi:23S rRNA (cytidine2498-2'-O)-methyltransferase